MDTGVDPTTAVATLRRRLEDTLRPLIEPVGRFALIDYPDYPNVGDNAIYLGQLACLRALGVARPRFIRDIRGYDRAALARSIGTSGTILLAGGGNFGDLWPDVQVVREDVIRSFPGVPIIQLPQTIHFENREALRRARAALSGHSNVTLLVRDERSLEIARNELRARSLLCPDMAFALGTLARPMAAVRSTLWLMRTDKESAGGRYPVPHEARADWLEEPVMPLRELARRLTGALGRRWLDPLLQPALSHAQDRLARQRLHRGLSMLASARCIVTDRLHGHILSLLLGIPHVVLDNGYGKLSGFHRAWTTGIEGVRWADSPDEARALAAELTESRAPLRPAGSAPRE